jgi:hypothetical protein
MLCKCGAARQMMSRLDVLHSVRRTIHWQERMRDKTFSMTARGRTAETRDSRPLARSSVLALPASGESERHRNGSLQELQNWIKGQLISLTDDDMETYP